VLKSPVLEELRAYVRAEGEAAGELQALRATVLNLGRQRFGRPASRKQKARLESLTDPAHLKRICEWLLRAASWADLLPKPRAEKRSPAGPPADAEERPFVNWRKYAAHILEELREPVRAESEAMGQRRALCDTLLRLGRQRFGRPAGRRQKARLEALTDLDDLERIRDRLLRATSWADLLATP
jgi:hypothetical protein